MLPEKVDHILHCEMKIFVKFFENEDTTPENLRKFCENLKNDEKSLSAHVFQ